MEIWRTLYRRRPRGQLSRIRCLISASDLLVPGTGLRLALNIYDVSVALKAT